MCDLMNRLGANQRAGSKPRCHCLTHGPRDEVADRLTALMGGHGTISAADQWMPVGFANRDEAILDRSPRLMNEEHGRILRSWWLAVPRGNRPNWDIASTATIRAFSGAL